MWTTDGIILPSGRLCAHPKDIDEPCILETVKETGELVTVTITQDDRETAAAMVRQRWLPHTCTRWCAPPDHAELHTYWRGTTPGVLRARERRAARLLGRTVERIVPVLTTDRPSTVLALVFFR
ncbi:MAG TPA: hypothetical protein VMD28_01950 [Acidimicrobiales bacterium]|nr:hypothetical protein [Acidimicrobiales bacterium]